MQLLINLHKQTIVRKSTLSSLFTNVHRVHNYVVELPTFLYKLPSYRLYFTT